MNSGSRRGHNAYNLLTMKMFDNQIWCQMNFSRHVKRRFDYCCRFFDGYQKQLTYKFKCHVQFEFQVTLAA